MKFAAISLASVLATASAFGVPVSALLVVFSELFFSLVSYQFSVEFCRSLPPPDRQLL
jgi:hypothetical protein